MSGLSIVTPGLRLLPVSAELAGLVASHREQAQRLCGLSFDPAWPEADMPPVMESYAKALRRVPQLLGWGIWLISHQGCVIGDAGFKGRPSHGVVEIGYSVVPRFQGRGFATQAVSALSQWAFSQGVTCVKAQCDAGNHASVAVLKKLNMRQVKASGSMLHWELVPADSDKKLSLPS